MVLKSVDTSDNNCDDEIDINMISGPTHYRDFDEDGFGNNEDSILSCLSQKDM